MVNLPGARAEFGREPNFDLTDEEIEQIRTDFEACHEDPDLLVDAREAIAELRPRV